MIGAGCLGATTNPPVTSVWLPPNALKTNPNAVSEKGVKHTGYPGYLRGGGGGVTGGEEGVGSHAEGV